MNWGRSFLLTGYVACAALFAVTGAALAKPDWFARKAPVIPAEVSPVVADAPTPTGIEWAEDVAPPPSPTPDGWVVEDGKVLAKPPTLRTKYPHLFPSAQPSKTRESLLAGRQNRAEPDDGFSVSVEFTPGVNSGRGCSVRVPGSPCAERARAASKGGIPFPVTNTVTPPAPPSSAGPVTPTSSLPQTETTVIKSKANIPFPVSSAPTPTPAPCDTD